VISASGLACGPARAAALLVLASLAPACIAPSVLESSGRAVEPPVAQFAWRAPEIGDFSGLFESISIEGDAAVSLWKVYYHFAPDGSYTGAALVLGGPQPEFQTLSGPWALDGDLLDLGDGQSVRASAAPGHLRLESEGGIAVLRQVAVE